MAELPPDMFEVEKLISKKVVNDKTFYRVKWKGYPINQSTWEVASNLDNIPNLINEYEKNLIDAKTEPCETKDKHIIEKNQTFWQKQLNTSQKIQRDPRTVDLEKGHKEKCIEKGKAKPPAKKKKKVREDLDLSESTTLSGLNRKQKTRDHTRKRNNKHQWTSRIISEECLESEEEDNKRRLFETFNEGVTSRSSTSKSKISTIARIRKLESIDPSSEIHEYLVEFVKGQLKIFTTIQMTIAYPFEFIEYLEKRAFKHV